MIATGKIMEELTEDGFSGQDYWKRLRAERKTE